MFPCKPFDPPTPCPSGTETMLFPRSRWLMSTVLSCEVKPLLSHCTRTVSFFFCSPLLAKQKMWHHGRMLTVQLEFRGKYRLFSNFHKCNRNPPFAETARQTVPLVNSFELLTWSLMKYSQRSWRRTNKLVILSNRVQVSEGGCFPLNIFHLVAQEDVVSWAKLRNRNVPSSANLIFVQNLSCNIRFHVCLERTFSISQLEGGGGGGHSLKPEAPKV